ncbi:MAG: methyltransferase domain-containing protein [Polyangiaceae bacterium]|nr:methyltransferase domain-containing protein [Polyangiaceae bacterium]
MSFIRRARTTLGQAFGRGPASAAPLRPAAELLPLLSLDLGCGAKKRAGFVGVDQRSLPGVDHVVDFAAEALPFATGSVGQVFSSHCIEHLADPLRLLREVTRVCADGAALELWAPYSWHGDAHFWDHVSAWNERQFLHMGSWQHEHWAERMGARWCVQELVFSIAPAVVRDLRANGVHPSFALRYYRDVAHELGVLVEIKKTGEPRGRAPRIGWATSREVADRQPLPSAAEARLLRLRGLRASALGDA